MSFFNEYSDKNPPKRGTAKKIYQALKDHGFTVWDLHYNPNCWGQGAHLGWGTWACHISDEDGGMERWCGWYGDRGAYLRDQSAPFSVYWLTKETANVGTVSV